MPLPKDANARKEIPLYSGCIAYFPDALAAVAALSKKGNDQHNPGKPLHWDRSKSGDELDAMMRHVVEGDWDAVAWRALANLQKQIENKNSKNLLSESEFAPVLDKTFRTEKELDDYLSSLQYTPVELPSGNWEIIDGLGQQRAVMFKQRYPTARAALDGFMEGRRGTG